MRWRGRAGQANAAVHGILLGGEYALVACWLSLMFGVMRVVNIAHGDLAVCGAYLGLVLSTAMGVPVWFTLPLLLPAAFAIGVVLQVVLVERALRGGTLAPILVTFGLATMIEDLLLVGRQRTPGRWTAAPARLRAWRWATTSQSPGCG